MSDVTELILKVKDKEAIKSLNRFNKTLDESSSKYENLTKLLLGGYGFSKLTSFVQSLDDSFTKLTSTSINYKRLFGNAIDIANTGVEKLKNNFNETSSSAKELLNNIALKMPNIGLDEKQIATLSVRFAILAKNINAVYTKSNMNDISKKLTSALAGQAGELKEIGIIIDQQSNSFKQRVVEMQKILNVSEQQAKVQVILNDLFKQGEKFSGQYELKAGSLVEMFTSLNKTLKEGVFAKAGQIISNILYPGLKLINELLKNETFQTLGGITTAFATLTGLGLTFKLAWGSALIYIFKLLKNINSQFGNAAITTSKMINAWKGYSKRGMISGTPINEVSGIDFFQKALANREKNYAAKLKTFQNKILRSIDTFTTKLIKSGKASNIAWASIITQYERGIASLIARIKMSFSSSSFLYGDPMSKGITEAAKAIGEVIRKINIAPITNAASTAIGNVSGTVLGSIITTIGIFFKNIFKYIKIGFSFLSKGIKFLFAGLGKTIMAIVGGVLKVIGLTLTVGLFKFLAIFIAAWAAIEMVISGIQTLFNGKSYMENLGNKKLGGLAEKLADWIIKTFTSNVRKAQEEAIARMQGEIEKRSEYRTEMAHAIEENYKRYKDLTIDSTNLFKSKSELLEVDTNDLTNYVKKFNDAQAKLNALKTSPRTGITKSQILAEEKFRFEEEKRLTEDMNSSLETINKLRKNIYDSQKSIFELELDNIKFFSDIDKKLSLFSSSQDFEHSIKTINDQIKKIKDSYKSLTKDDQYTYNKKMINLYIEKFDLESNMLKAEQDLIIKTNDFIKDKLEDILGFKEQGVSGIAANTEAGYRYMTSTVGQVADLKPILESQDQKANQLREKQVSLIGKTKDAVSDIKKAVEAYVKKPDLVLQVINI